MCSRNFLRNVSLVCCLLSLVSCAGRRPVPVSHDPAPEVMGPVIPDQNVEEHVVENYGPEVPPDGVTPPTPLETAATATETAIQTAVQSSGQTSTDTTVGPPPADAKLCLVLGPGAAKAMAEAAVLATLRKAKLPIHCVVGTEMGAVVAALYSFSNGSVNNLQWQLFKLNKDTWFNFPMLSLRDPKSTGRKLNEFLRAVFKDKKIESLPIPFATIAVDEERDTGAEFDKGDLTDALSASIAVPGIFDPWKAGDAQFRSAALTEPAPVDLARKLGGNFIVVVDVLADPSTAAKSRFHKIFAPARSLLKLQRKEAQFVIQVNASAIPFDDFGRQGEILAAGTAAAEKALPDLKAAWERWSAGAR